MTNNSIKYNWLYDILATSRLMATGNVLRRNVTREEEFVTKSNTHQDEPEGGIRKNYAV